MRVQEWCTFEGCAEGGWLEVDGEEVAVGTLLGGVMGIVGFDNGDCSNTMNSEYIRKVLVRARS